MYASNIWFFSSRGRSYIYKLARHIKDRQIMLCFTIFKMRNSHKSQFNIQLKGNHQRVFGITDWLRICFVNLTCITVFGPWKKCLQNNFCFLISSTAVFLQMFIVCNISCSDIINCNWCNCGQKLCLFT